MVAVASKASVTLNTKLPGAPEGRRRTPAAGVRAAAALLAAFMAGAWVQAHLSGPAAGLMLGRHAQQGIRMPPGALGTWFPEGSSLGGNGGGSAHLAPNQAASSWHRRGSGAGGSVSQRRKLRAFVGIFSSFSVPRSAKDDDKVSHSVSRQAPMRAHFPAQLHALFSMLCA